MNHLLTYPAGPESIREIPIQSKNLQRRLQITNENNSNLEKLTILCTYLYTMYVFWNYDRIISSLNYINFFCIKIIITVAYGFRSMSYTNIIKKNVYY